jgi:polyhydroxyalkanoate synthesis regulator protein
MLVRIIRMNDQLVKDFIEKYFNQALQSFLDYQRRVEEQIRQTHGLPSTLPLVSAWTKAVLEPISSAFSWRGQENASADQTNRSAEGVAQLEQTVRDLQAQVAALQPRRRQNPVKRPKKRS